MLNRYDNSITVSRVVFPAVKLFVTRVSLYTHEIYSMEGGEDMLWEVM